MSIQEARNRDLYDAILIALKNNNKTENDILEVIIGQKLVIDWDDFKKVIRAMKPFKTIYEEDESDCPFAYSSDIILVGPDLYMECYFDEDRWDMSFYKTFVQFPAVNSKLNIGEAIEGALEELFLINSVRDIYISPDINKERRLPLWYNGKILRFKYKDNDYSIHSDGNIRCLLYKKGCDELITSVNQEKDGLKSFDSRIGSFLKVDADIWDAIKGTHNLFRLEFDKRGHRAWYITIDCADGHKSTHVLEEDILHRAIYDVIRKYL